MIDCMDQALGPASGPAEVIVRSAERLAFRMGICFLMQRSEYLPNGRGSRGALWKHATFFDV
jgi:hypothetical protein